MKYTIAALLFLVSLFSAAQRSDTLAIIDLEPVIISTLRYEERPSFSLLKTEALKINNGYEVQNVLNQVAGVYMHSGTLSTNRITIRGVGNRSLFSTSKIRAYLEDIPLTSGIGETSLEDIDLSFISEIEVWKGPTASRFGAGLGGMIHYRVPSRQRNGISSDLQVGAAGLIRNSTTLSLGNNSTGRFLVNFNTTATKGWRENSEYQRNGINLLWNKFSNRYSVQAVFMAIDLNGQIPSSIDLDDYQSDPSKAAFTWKSVEGFEAYQKILTGISYSQKLGEKWNLKNSLFLKYRNGYESRPFNILSDGDYSGGLRSLVEYRAGKWKVLSGVEYYRENYDWRTFETNQGIQGVLISDQLENRSYINVFEEIHYNISDAWSLDLGVNFNKTQYDFTDQFINDGDDSGIYSYNLIASPNGNLRYKPSDKHLYYLTVSKGFSTPTLEETLTPDGLINEEIGPETGWNFEVGSRGYISPRLSYDIGIYQMRISNLLVTRMEEDITTGLDQIISVNAGETRQTGLDAMINANVLNSQSSRMDINFSYSLQDYSFLNFVEDASDYSGNTLTGTIPNRISSSLSYKSGAFSGNISYFFTDAMPMRDDNSVSSDPYSLVNTRLSYQIQLGKHSIELYTGVNNLLDTKYASMILINAGAFGNNQPRYYYPGQPLNMYGGIRWEMFSGEEE